jgi:2-dehydro-3-deoxyphosphooctonate aldolase (KDO 8-P synthase)
VTAAVSVQTSLRDLLPSAPGASARPLLIAGPCAIESRQQVVSTASGLQTAAHAAGFDFIFKASFDKANRSSVSAWRGPGLVAGLELLSELRDELELPVVCDIHEPGQAEAAARHVDALQIPAFLCRQTDLLLAAAATGLPINLKKGQFLAPWHIHGAVEKLQSGGAKQILLTERGTSFGHGDLVVDFRGLNDLRATGCPTLFDASHSAQQPGAHGDRSGGNRDWSPLLARAAAAAGFDGLYLEVHPSPAEALSDRDTQWPLSDIAALLEHFKVPWQACRDLPNFRRLP